jgi:hypothetical protein
MRKKAILDCHLVHQICGKVKTKQKKIVEKRMRLEKTAKKNLSLFLNKSFTDKTSPETKKNEEKLRKILISTYQITF